MVRPEIDNPDGCKIRAVIRHMTAVEISREFCPAVYGQNAK
jgi:hypothetical protein